MKPKSPTTPPAHSAKASSPSAAKAIKRGRPATAKAVVAKISPASPRPATRRGRSAASKTPAPSSRPAAIASKETSKQARLIALMRSPAGATLEQLMKLTGWQAHTVRGTISGVLRKRLGLEVQSLARGDAPRIYRIVGAA